MDRKSVAKDDVPVKNFTEDPFSPSLREKLDILAKASHGEEYGEEFHQANTEEFLKEIGLELFKILLVDGNGHSHYNGKETLALRIREEAFSLLPWELMHDGQQFIAPRTGVFRVYESKEELNFTPAEGRLKITAGFASPILDPRLPPESPHQPHRLKFHREIQALKKIKGIPTELRILHPLFRSAFQDICQSDVLLFSCHGNQGGLLLEDRCGQADPMGLDFFREFFPLDSPLKLALFNSCLTASAQYDKKAGELAGVADTFMKLGLPTSMGMQFSITHEAGEIFTQMIVKGISGGESILAALRQYRSKIRMERVGFSWDWAAPVLFVHEEITKSLEDKRFIGEGQGETKIRENERAPFIEMRKDELFVGRRQELADIVRELDFEASHPHTACLVKGMGGNGKSALAVEYANHFSHLYREILWISARDARPSDDVMEHTVGVDPLAIKRDPKSFFQELTKKLEGITLKGEESIQDIRDALLHRLNDELPRLLIMDNMESFQDLDMIRHLLNNIPENNRVLLTSREELPGVNYFKVELQTLDREGATDLMIGFAGSKRYPLPVQLVEPIFKKTGWHPLTMRLFIAYLANMKKDWKAIERDLASMKGEPFKYVLEKSVHAAG